MRQHFNPENLETWLNYYGSQASQTGYGLSSGFRGAPYQRGAGLGSFFRSLFRMAVPVIKSAAGHIGRQALSSGVDIAHDIVQGKPIGDAFEEHSRAGLADLVVKAKKAVQKGRGLGSRPKLIKGQSVDIFDKKAKKPRKNGARR
jgi:hypothetical protein